MDMAVICCAHRHSSCRAQLGVARCIKTCVPTATYGPADPAVQSPSDCCTARTYTTRVHTCARRNITEARNIHVSDSGTARHICVCVCVCVVCVCVCVCGVCVVCVCVVCVVCVCVCVCVVCVCVWCVCVWCVLFLCTKLLTPPSNDSFVTALKQKRKKLFAWAPCCCHTWFVNLYYPAAIPLPPHKLARGY